MTSFSKSSIISLNESCLTIKRKFSIPPLPARRPNYLFLNFCQPPLCIFYLFYKRHIPVCKSLSSLPFITKSPIFKNYFCAFSHSFKLMKNDAQLTVSTLPIPRNSSVICLSSLENLTKLFLPGIHGFRVRLSFFALSIPISISSLHS